MRRPGIRSVRLSLAAVAVGALAGLACADRRAEEPPPYTRLEGRAPELPGQAAGATLVVFWATWCPPCREELPGLLALARDPPAGLAVLTFGEDGDEAPVRTFFGGTPPAELGLHRDVDRRAAEAFGVEVLPAAFLVVNGRMVARFSGPRDWSSAGTRRLLARLATEAPPAASPGRGTGVDASSDRR